MFCHKCGTQLPEESDFCHKCGVAFNINAQSPVAAGTKGSQQLQPREVLDLLARRLHYKTADGFFESLGHALSTFLMKIFGILLAGLAGLIICFPIALHYMSYNNENIPVVVLMYVLMIPISIGIFVGLFKLAGGFKREWKTKGQICLEGVPKAVIYTFVNAPEVTDFLNRFFAEYGYITFLEDTRDNSLAFGRETSRIKFVFAYNHVKLSEVIVFSFPANPYDSGIVKVEEKGASEGGGINKIGLFVLEALNVYYLMKTGANKSPFIIADKGEVLLA